MFFDKNMSIAAFSAPKSNLYLNQDSLLLPIRVENSYVLALADGMGGTDCGDVAARLAIDVVRASLSKISPSSLIKIFDIVREKIEREAKQDLRFSKMGTTLTICCVDQDGLKIAYSGDTRVYACINGKLNQLTKDHNLREEYLENHSYLPKKIIMNQKSERLIAALAPGIEHRATYIEYDDPIAAFYVMSDGAYKFWEKRRRAAKSTLSDANKFASLIKKRIKKAGAVDDYSLIGISFEAEVGAV